MSQPGHAIVPPILLANEFAGALSVTDAKAYLSLAGVSSIDTVVQAKLPGSAGNDITIQLFTDITDGIAATGVLTLAANATRANAFNTLTFAGNPSDTQTVTINGKVYTFLTILLNVNGNVLIGATASDSLDNLIAAINLGAGSGTTYAAATTLHPTVNAAAGAGDTLIGTAKSPGTGGNALTAASTVTGGTWTAGTFAGGATAETVVVGAKTYSFVNFLAAANDVKIGATASDTIDNLIAAINDSVGEGTVYGTGTTANASASAAVGAGDTMGLTALAEGTAGNSIATTETMAQGSFAAVTLLGGIAGGTNTLTDDADAGTVVIHAAPNDTTYAELETLIGTSTLIEVKTAGTGSNTVALADDFAATNLALGSEVGAAIPDHIRTNKAWIILKRGAGGSGAVTVANGKLLGRINDDDGEDFIRIANLGTMTFSAVEDGFAVLVEGVGCFKRLAFDSDAISSDTVDAYALFVNQIQA